MVGIHVLFKRRIDIGYAPRAPADIMHVTCYKWLALL